VRRGIRDLFLLWFPLIGYLGAIFLLSAQRPNRLKPLPSPYFVHIVEYFILALLMFRALNGGLRRKIRVKSSTLVVCFSLLYAISDELHQSFVPGRNADPRDVLADFIGIAVGLIAIFAFQRWIKKPPDKYPIKSEI